MTALAAVNIGLSLPAAAKGSENDLVTIAGLTAVTAAGELVAGATGGYVAALAKKKCLRNLLATSTEKACVMVATARLQANGGPRRLKAERKHQA